MKGVLESPFLVPGFVQETFHFFVFSLSLKVVLFRHIPSSRYRRESQTFTPIPRVRAGTGHEAFPGAFLPQGYARETKTFKGREMVQVVRLSRGRKYYRDFRESQPFLGISGPRTCRLSACFPGLRPTPGHFSGHEAGKRRESPEKFHIFGLRKPARHEWSGAE